MTLRARIPANGDVDRRILNYTYARLQVDVASDLAALGR